MPSGDSSLRAAMFFRSFLVQASWNFERMQNLGFALIMAPALKRKYGAASEAFASAFERHLAFFNTHPYFAGLVAGAVATEEGAQFDRGRYLEDLKHSLMSVMGSIGDRFFWASLRPFAALAAAVPALFGIWWAPLLFLALFNGPHLFLRWWGVSAGLRYGCQVIRPIQSLPLAGLASALSVAAAALAGFVAGTTALHPRWRPFSESVTISLATGFLLFLAGVLLGRPRGKGEAA